MSFFQKVEVQVLGIQTVAACVRVRFLSGESLQELRPIKVERCSFASLPDIPLMA